MNFDNADSFQAQYFEGGGFSYSPFSSVIFLAIGTGAIFQIIIIILNMIRVERKSNLSSAAVVSGISVGMVVMYLTGILI